MSVNNPNVNRYNHKTGAFHAHMRELLLWIADRGEATNNEIAAHYQWQQSRACRATMHLSNLGFLGVKGKQEVSPGFACLVYVVMPHSEGELDRQLWTSKEIMYAALGIQDEPLHGANRRRNKGGVPRDYMDTLLMGHGPAPSIAFNKAQHDSHQSQ